MNFESQSNLKPVEEQGSEKGIDSKTAEWPADIAQAPEYNHHAFREGHAAETLAYSHSKREGVSLEPQEQYDAVVKNIAFLKESGAALKIPDSKAFLRPLR